MKPGSEEAVEKGCSCSISDNQSGEGIPINGKRHYWITADCPIHWKPRSEDLLDGVYNRGEWLFPVGHLYGGKKGKHPTYFRY